MDQIITAALHTLASQGPLVLVLLLGLYYFYNKSKADDAERKAGQQAYLDLLKEINRTIQEHTKVDEKLGSGFEIIVNHILNNKTHP